MVYNTGSECPCKYALTLLDRRIYIYHYYYYLTYFNNAWPRAKAQFVKRRQVCSSIHVVYIIYYIYIHVCTKRTIFTCYPVILTYTNYDVRDGIYSKNNHPAARPVKIYNIISKRTLQLQVLFKI